MNFRYCGHPSVTEKYRCILGISGTGSNHGCLSKKLLGSSLPHDISPVTCSPYLAGKKVIAMINQCSLLSVLFTSGIIYLLLAVLFSSHCLAPETYVKVFP